MDGSYNFINGSVSLYESTQAQRRQRGNITTSGGDSQAVPGQRFDTDSAQYLRTAPTSSPQSMSYYPSPQGHGEPQERQSFIPPSYDDGNYNPTQSVNGAAVSNVFTHNNNVGRPAPPFRDSAAISDTMTHGSFSPAPSAIFRPVHQQGGSPSQFVGNSPIGSLATHTGLFSIPAPSPSHDRSFATAPVTTAFPQNRSDFQRPRNERPQPLVNNGLGVSIPQGRYRPHRDARRYGDEVALELPITFVLRGPCQAGIPLRDALENRFVRLEGRDDPVFVNSGLSVSIRIQWPGYKPWSKQIPTKNFKKSREPVIRSKLAHEVAKCVDKFLQEHAGHAMEHDTDPKWRVGPGFITVNDLVLVSLSHVSQGSWQPDLRLAQRSAVF